MIGAKLFLNFMLERLRAERTDENLWTVFYLTGEYVEFLKQIYRKEK
jgi:hypothetical protein